MVASNARMEQPTLSDAESHSRSGGRRTGIAIANEPLPLGLATATPAFSSSFDMTNDRATQLHPSCLGLWR